jgi:hypothetical protein
MVTTGMGIELPGRHSTMAVPFFIRRHPTVVAYPQLSNKIINGQIKYSFNRLSLSASVYML